MKKKININSVCNNKTFQEGVDEFIRYCKVRNLREASIKSYQDTIDFEWYKFYKKDDLIVNVTERVVEDFVLFLRTNTSQQDNSIAIHLRRMRTILNYFMKLDYIEKFEIKTIKTTKNTIETYTDSQLELLLIKPDLKKCSYVEYRNWATINFLLATGCRISTLINVKIMDLDFENDLIYYTHTKNRKKHVVPMSKTLKKILSEYITYRQAESNEDYLFVSAFGEKCNRITLCDSLNQYNKKRGVMQTGVHKYRHTFAKKWILAGGNIFKLQKILQHATMEMVKSYVNIFNAEISSDFDEFNPLEQLQCKSKQHISIRGYKK